MPTTKRPKKEIKHKPLSKLVHTIDRLLIIIIIASLAFFSADYVFIGAYFLLMIYLYLTKRMVLLYHLMVASAVALTWMLIAKSNYGYNSDLLSIAGINLYPLFAWAVGLFVMYILYSHYEHILKKQTFIRKLLLFTAFYLPILIGFETLAYHVFNIRNISAAIYPGLPICDCIHAPRWMQTVYLLMGPIFFTICYLFKLENPHAKNNLKKN